MIDPYRPAIDEVGPVPAAAPTALPRSLRLVVLLFFLLGGLVLAGVGVMGLRLRLGAYEPEWTLWHVEGATLLLLSFTLWAPSGIMLVGNKDDSRLRLGLLGVTLVLLCAATIILGARVVMPELSGESWSSSVTSEELVLGAAFALLVALPIGHKAAFEPRFGSWSIPVLLGLALVCVNPVLHDQFPVHNFLWCGPPPLLLFAISGVGLAVKRPTTKGPIAHLPRLLAATTMLPAAAAAVLATELRESWVRTVPLGYYYDVGINHAMATLIVVGTIASLLAWSPAFFGRDASAATGLGAVIVALGMATTTVGFFVLGLRETASNSYRPNSVGGELESVCTIASCFTALGVLVVIGGLALGRVPRSVAAPA